ncbi:Mannosylfructose-phosphate phosphatase [Mariniflexile rhizosphaerae]|uniref:HAD-IIB family hydrolase n=1 Tax=unclassified Mariniflexile TaxID=2643887 RepID=UPI000CB2F670|nr:HAD-IIB family hydrolase [Mariniflexile sp. TRM1-10]AXP79515.1 Mannosylfructose-phosphate phosphatase [Mariniflexile sp. TRM1-10]PLB19471.1 MAG: Glycogen debranching enzyme-like protein [Flavobacteriaceae bacterium FS1-H7996/R]
MDVKKSNKQHDIKLLSFDVDNTLLEFHTLKTNFTTIWNTYKPDSEVLLTYNSGRLIDDVLNLIKKGVLPEPHYIIAGVGTLIYDYKNKSIVKEFNDVLDEGWDLEAVEELISNINYPISEQPTKFQHAYKRSYYLHDAGPELIDNIEEVFASAKMHVNVVYSGEKFLDILPKWANKGNALQWLLNKLDVESHSTLVAGDSGNDCAMFDMEDVKGIVVANAHEELYKYTKHRQVYHSESDYSNGIIEGLVYYGILPEDAINTNNEDHSDDFFIKKELNNAAAHEDEDEKIALIREGYDKAIEALRKNITPLGFSACSMKDNVPNGTDENYHSVWARDGAITVIGSLPLLHDKEIHKCQRQTLLTLMEHISRSGQIPSNVRIKDNVPDYSGVGGICSIDSGLWVVIAFFEYVNVTKDIAFLRDHVSDIKETMRWLGAHDGNNDALLEIPEAGDWTDLFGRSYNILYDEILWYRANVCFGRMLEMLGDYEQAGEYIRWSQVIKKEILQNFWPSTQQKLFQSFSFAERQFSLGDTTYLIAQVTPFDFSWRCDILGNVLAFLHGTIDADKAHQTLRFMLGVGVNEPFPVANVYPVVSPGDPDWRPYYTVNLLNLPNHYHNGGIWPFVGGFWVKFINKLGLKEMAIAELHKLALINKEGVNEAWEFTEWAHGITGKPMGKSYQAWSAAQYISACHDLKII